MKNITVTVDDDLYRRARVRAAEQGTNVSAVVRNALQRFTAEPDDAEKKRARLHALYEAVDARVAALGPRNVPEPGWRDAMYDERFDNSVLGRSLARRR